MNRSTLALVTSAVLALSFDASAAPPGGVGGGGRPGAGMPGGMADKGVMDRSLQDRTAAAPQGHNVSEQLNDNAKLSSEIKELTGSNAQQACAGFKTLGDCVSAAHVSKNLGIPFDTLSAKLTGSGAVSLGKAIHELRPDADAKSAMREASKQTKADLQASHL